MRAIRQPDLRTSTRMTGPGWEHGARGRRSRWQGRVPIIVLRTLILAVLGAAFLLRMNVEAEENSNAAPSAVEQFKQFISSPPVIKNLVFQQKVPMDGGARPLDGTFALSTRFEYFQAKWQTNGMLFRGLNSPGDATNLAVAGNLVSISGHTHALFEPGRQVTFWDDRDPTVARKRISVFYTSQFVQEPLRRILNLGVMYAGIGTLKWDGNRFETGCEVDHEHIGITGELLPTPNGPPTGLHIRYAFPHQTYNYAIRYTYGPSLRHPFLPAEISSFWLPQDRSGTEIEVDDWRILDFESTNAPVSDVVFDAGLFAQFNHWPTRVYTNGGFYDRGTNGELQLAFLLDAFMKGSASRLRIPRALLYLGWGGMNVAIFALLLGAKETSKQTIKQESNIRL